jgi:hypothetical protein
MLIRSGPIAQTPDSLSLSPQLVNLNKQGDAGSSAADRQMHPIQHPFDREEEGIALPTTRKQIASYSAETCRAIANTETSTDRLA